MDPKIIDIIAKSGVAGTLVGLLGFILYWAKEERIESRKQNTQELMPVLKSIAEDLNRISNGYVPETK